MVWPSVSFIEQLCQVLKRSIGSFIVKQQPEILDNSDSLSLEGNHFDWLCQVFLQFPGYRI